MSISYAPKGYLPFLMKIDLFEGVSFWRDALRISCSLRGGLPNFSPVDRPVGVAVRGGGNLGSVA